MLLAAAPPPTTQERHGSTSRTYQLPGTGNQLRSAVNHRVYRPAFRRRRPLCPRLQKVLTQQFQLTYTGLIWSNSGHVDQFNENCLSVCVIVILWNQLTTPGLITEAMDRGGGVVVRSGVCRSADRLRLGLGAVRGAAEAAQAAADVLVEEAERGCHDDAEVRQGVQRQRNADDCVEHRCESARVSARCYVTVTCSQPAGQ